MIIKNNNFPCISTGNWCCGAFNVDSQLKSIIFFYIIFKFFEIPVSCTFCISFVNVILLFLYNSAAATLLLVVFSSLNKNVI